MLSVSCCAVFVIFSDQVPVISGSAWKSGELPLGPVLSGSCLHLAWSCLAWAPFLRCLHPWLHLVTFHLGRGPSAGGPPGPSPLPGYIRGLPARRRTWCPGGLCSGACGRAAVDLGRGFTCSCLTYKFAPVPVPVPSGWPHAWRPLCAGWASLLGTLAGPGPSFSPRWPLWLERVTTEWPSGTEGCAYCRDPAWGRPCGLREPGHPLGLRFLPCQSGAFSRPSVLWAGLSLNVQLVDGAHADVRGRLSPASQSGSHRPTQPVGHPPPPSYDSAPSPPNAASGAVR